MTPVARQILLSFFIVCLFILLAALMSAEARNMMGPGAYYDQQLDVIIRGNPGGQQIYQSKKDVWYNYDINLQNNKSLQEFQLHNLPQGDEQKILSQLSQEQQGYGTIQPGLTNVGQERRDAEQYNQNYRTRHGMEALPNNTLIPAPGMPLDPYAKQGARNNTTCIDPQSGFAYICPQP